MYYLKEYEAIGTEKIYRISFISMISPTDTPMLSRFGKPRQQHFTRMASDALDAASYTGVVEGSDVETAAFLNLQVV